MVLIPVKQSYFLCIDPSSRCCFLSWQSVSNLFCSVSSKACVLYLQFNVSEEAVTSCYLTSASCGH